MTSEAVEILQARLGHVFVRRELLLEALTHPSRIHLHPEDGPHNQRLEFLGDAVLQLILTEALHAADPNADEGELSRRRTVLVASSTLARLGRELGLPGALRLGGGEDSEEGRNRPSNLEDAFEALVGALYLDAGLDRARACVLRLYGPLEERLARELGQVNPKGRLQERLQALVGSPPPRYETVQSGGPDHAKHYASRVYSGDRLLGVGGGSSKKAAEEEAARAALALLDAEAADVGGRA